MTKMMYLAVARILMAVRENHNEAVLTSEHGLRA